MSTSLGHCTDTSNSLVDIDSDHSSTPESETGQGGRQEDPGVPGGLPLHHTHSTHSHPQDHLPLTSHYSNNNNVPTKPPFLLPAQLYKSLLASAVLGKTDKIHSGVQNSVVPAFPRNLLFSCAEKSPGSDTDVDEHSVHDEKAAAAAAFVWSGDTAPGGNQGSGGTPGPGNSPATSCSPAGSHTGHTGHSGHTTGHAGLGGVSGPGAQGQNPTQGLVHWMSVMAEHMTTNSHHDPTGVGVHYMWNGGVDQCGQHAKEMEYSGWPGPRNAMAMKQGYEAKMNSVDHQNINMQKGHLDDGRMDGHHGQGGTMTPSLYGSGAGRSGSSNSSSPAGGPGTGPGSAALLVVPQPINASKMAGQPGGMPNGATGRKYQCKMCPQVRGRKRGGGGTNKPRDPLSWSPLDHSNSEIFGSKADLQLHTQIHMREAKPYKCSQCSKAFANSSYLSQHTRIHLGIKPYRCEICQRKFTQLSHLQQHIRTHTGDKPYKCRHPGCQKAFSQLSNLQSHSRCHQTDKPYKCNSCYKCFSDEPSLLEHIPKHKESKHLKTHICQYCGKSYTQETYLTKHMQKHAERTDKRPPITGLGLGLNRNLSMTPNTPLSVGAGDHPYWPKVSPDSAASLAEAMSQAQQHEFGQQHATVGDHHLQNHHRSLLEHHSRMNGDVVEDLVIRHNPNLGHIGVQNPPAPPSTPIVSSATNYDTSLTKTTTSSAFTPINSMNLGHHQLAQRPYLYDPISFQNKNGNQAGVTNSFPNQLISLHQIRNYAHQPAPGGLMSSDHLIGVGVGGIKDKGQ